MSAAKRRCKNIDSVNEYDENQQQHLEIESVLLPGLPNHLAQHCLSTLHPSLLYKVCMSWRRLLYSPCFPPFFSLYALLHPNSATTPSANCVRGHCQSHSVAFFCFEPISSKWRSLPSPPSDPPLCLLRRHPSFLSRNLPVQSITASGRLVLIAANTHELLPALARPLVFDPLSSKWNFGPPFSPPRRWCATGSIHSMVYVASGTGAQFHSDVARSLEKWDMSKNETGWDWEKMVSLRDGRFSREATEALGYRGKLYMVNVKGKAVKEGAVYDTLMNQWEAMPRGMLQGWNGPATVDDDVMYVVDQEKGSLRKYDGDNDRWEEMIQPLEHLIGAEHISAGRGKVCAVSADGGKIVVVDILTRPPKVWMVNPPQGMEVIAVHILPRMILPDH
ncbi:UNVERIFIED_CONTAM: F-box/kelch-repeat protein SKIP25 [Sesamum radiatum]|uniref:F-box/kelch-repeat protein SKIP25 n=1 Tax=Sesamum radiatum TaxID=300843 RepID=A0AAW2R228_SESRA